MPFLLPPAPAEDYICVKIEIPNTDQDIRNFLGQLLGLGQWFNYERTGNDLGKQVADTWRTSLQNTLIGACMIVRQDPENPCILQSSDDGGETWVEFADITECVNSDYIASLIANNPALQQLIGQYSLTSAIDENSDLIPANQTTQLITNQAGCDNDNIYGMTLQLVELLNAVAEDILEIFVSAPTAIARFGDIIEAIPGIGELPLDDAFQFVESVLDDWNQAYQAAFTESLKIEIACDLFCIAQANGCTLTMEEARLYFYEKLEGMQPSNNWLAFMEQLIAYNWIGVTTVYGFFFLILHTLITGGEILGLDVNRIVTAVNAMFNDPDPDWSTNCGDCGWSFTCDFTVENCDFYAYQLPAPYNSPIGEYVNATGWDTTDVQEGSAQFARSTNPSIDFVDTHIETISITFDFVEGFWGQVSEVAVAIFGYLNGSLVYTATQTRQDTPDGNDQVKLVAPQQTLDTIRVIVRPSTSTSGTFNLSGSALVTSITITGEGDNPFV